MASKESGVAPNEKNAATEKSPREKFDEAARKLGDEEWVIADEDRYVLLKHGSEVTYQLVDDVILQATAPTGVVVPPNRKAAVRALESHFEAWSQKFGCYERSEAGEVILNCTIPLGTSEDMEKAADIILSLAFKMPAIKECAAGKAPTKSLAALAGEGDGIRPDMISQLLDTIG